MSAQNRILEELRRGRTVKELARVLDMREQTVRAMVELLKHQGRLREVDPNSSCEGCPMSDSCPVPTQGREKLYVVDEEGEGVAGPEE